MAAASAVDPWAPRPEAVHAVMAATPRGGATEGALLTQFSEDERQVSGGH